MTVPSPDLLGALAIKALGALLGAFFALVVLPPKTWREFVSRAIVTFGVGMLFAPIVLFYTAWPTEHMMPASFVAAFVSWWLMGAVIKAARAWTLPPK